MHSAQCCTVAVLELCAGGSLQRQLQKLHARGRDKSGHTMALSEREVSVLGGQVLSALSHLHGLDIVHRDIKPANILLFADKHLKLCDFGFARVCGGQRLHTICGTPVYMAPELTRGATMCKKGYDGPPVDAWAFGALLYEMLHNQVAFSGTCSEQLFRRIRAGRHSATRSDLSKGWSAISKDLLCTNPSKRPSSRVLDLP